MNDLVLAKSFRFPSFLKERQVILFLRRVSLLLYHSFQWLTQHPVRHEHTLYIHYDTKFCGFFASFPQRGMAVPVTEDIFSST